MPTRLFPDERDHARGEHHGEHVEAKNGGMGGIVGLKLDSKHNVSGAM
jgi:hypothetical protein